MPAITDDQSYLKSLTILYVEDEELSRSLFSDFFTRVAGRLIIAANGAEGLEAYRTQKPDIIVSDIQMPVMNGLNMASGIRTMDRSVPIILLSAFDDAGFLMKSINIGIDRYVTKPVDARDLQEALLSCAHRLRVEAAVIRAKKEWEQTFDSLPDLISITDNSQTILRVNRAMAIHCGLTPQEMIGRKCHDVMHCTSEPVANCPFEKATLTRCEHIQGVDQKESSRFFDISVSPISDSEGGNNRCVHFARDVTERKLMEDELQRAKAAAEALSRTDGLTGLANRRHFDEVLAKEYARHIRSGLPLSLIILDIDLFKSFNDTYGHVAGDSCLQQVARVIAECTYRINDLAARYGGEEFTSILPETDQQGALHIAERIRQGIIDLAIPHAGSTVAEYVTASLGVLTGYGNLETTATDMVVRADELLYKAKSNGRNRLECNEIDKKRRP